MKTRERGISFAITIYNKVIRKGLYMKRRLLAIALCSCFLVGCSNDLHNETIGHSESVDNINAETEEKFNTSETEITESISNVSESSIPAEITFNTESFEGEITKWAVSTSPEYPNSVWLATPIILAGEKFDESTESEIWKRSYLALADLFENYTTDALYINVVFLDMTNGGKDIIGSTNISNLSGFNVSPIEWTGKYEKWDNTETNQSAADLINLRIKNPIEINGYRVTFPGTYSFRKVDNEYTDINGSIVVAIDVTIENLSSSYIFCTLEDRISTPNMSANIFDCSSLFSDLSITRKCPIGSSFTGAFCIPYDGVGDYTISFGAFPIAGSYRIEITDTPEERGIIPNKANE